jgi:hypothetical protein
MTVKIGFGPRPLGATIFVLVLVLAAAGCHAPQPGGEEQPAAETAEEEKPSGETASAPSSRSTASSPAREARESEGTKEANVKAEAPAAPAPPPPQIVEVEIPAGTVLELELLTPIDSSLNRAGDELQARTVSPLFVDGKQVLESGAYVEGRITEAKASGKVKGRAHIAFTFDRLKAPKGTVDIKTSYVEQEAKSGKKKDAAVIGGAAGVGAIVGGIIGGKKGAAIGATVGGAGGTGVVLSTKGEEIRLAAGARVNVRLDDPVVIQLD